ncbi:MAG: aldolase [Acetobacteraceae bacterium]
MATSQPKSVYYERTAAQMEQHLEAPDWSPEEKLALACRMLAAEGHDSGLAGQLTTRGPDPGTYWMLRFGLGFDEATADGLLLVDDDLRVLRGDGMPNPSNRFHLWIYRHRPAVACIVHTHPPHVSALSMIGEPLAVSHMDTSMFYNDCAYLPEWPGVPIGDDEGQLISSALGNNRAILLAHHGLLTASGSVEEAAVLALFMERAARLQLLARSAGTIRPIPSERAQEAHDYRLKPKPIGATFAYYARRVLRSDRGVLGGALRAV